MSVPEHDLERIVRLLLQDVEATIGPGHEAEVLHNAMHLASWVDDPDTCGQRLCDDVQQYFHDCFVDTTWPACPRHSTHPLWLHGESWYCERDGVEIARLGELRSVV